MSAFGLSAFPSGDDGGGGQERSRMNRGLERLTRRKMMRNIVTFNELLRLSPDKLYWYYRQLSLTLNTTEHGSHERRIVLASIENVIHAINLHNIGQWKYNL